MTETDCPTCGAARGAPCSSRLTHVARLERAASKMGRAWLASIAVRDADGSTHRPHYHASGALAWVTIPA